MKRLWAIALLLIQFSLAAQQPRYSTEADKGFSPCWDTIRILGFKTVRDISPIFPTWLPVVNYDTVVVAEGIVLGGEQAPRISHEDFPLYHYTHDFTFNLKLDSGYTNLLAYQVNKGDTNKQQTLHIEWESGLGAYNATNPQNVMGSEVQSSGFASSGYDEVYKIWWWPTVGDWVHVEGLWIWDRGHPPAETEIHPARLMAIRRALPDVIKLNDTTQRFATRVDIYANGDGGALQNNRRGQPDYVKLTKMSLRNYTFTVKHTLSKPSPNAKLRYDLVGKLNDTYRQPLNIVIDTVNATATVTIPWKEYKVSDAAVLAQSLYLYWDEGTGCADPINKVVVYPQRFKIKRYRDFLSKPETVAFMSVGNNYYLLNDVLAPPNYKRIIALYKNYKRKWYFANKLDSVVVYTLPNQPIRIATFGYEGDGMNNIMGTIINPNSPCDKLTKEVLDTTLFSMKKVGLKGCLDDNLGNIEYLFSGNYYQLTELLLKPERGRNNDICPCSKYKLHKGYNLKVNVKNYAP